MGRGAGEIPQGPAGPPARRARPQKVCNKQKRGKTMKKFLAIVLSAVMLLSLAACGGSASSAPAASTPAASTPADDASSAPAPKSDKKIGACAASLSFDFQIQMSNGIERAAKEHGYEYMVYDYNFDAEQMLSGLETLAASDVGAMYGLFLAPESATDFMKSHPEIGVLTQGEIVDGALACTENDYIALANQFVEALDRYVTENNITEGGITGLWLEPCENEDSEYYGAKEDIKAVINEWCEGKDFYFESDFYPADDEEAANTTAQILNATPDVKFFFCFNNGYAIAAANEIGSATSDANGYFVFSSEGDPESFRLIDSGTSAYRACAYMDIEESGYQVGLQLINWVENGKMENVIVSKDLVDISNVKDYLG